MHPNSTEKGLLHSISPLGSPAAHDYLMRLLALVPALPENLLRLEALLELPTVDLNALGDAIRVDLGLTLRILQLAPVSLEPGFGMLEQCVLEAGIQCLRVVGRTTPALAQANRHPQLHETLQLLWRHSRATARIAERIAEAGAQVDPERAYLAGLLHDVTVLKDALSALVNEDDAPGANGVAVLPPDDFPEDKDKDTADVRRLVLAWKIPAYALESIQTRGLILRCVGPIASVVAVAHEKVSDQEEFSPPCIGGRHR